MITRLNAETLNKLLPIILVVVLSGISSLSASTIENCADRTYIDEGWSWWPTDFADDFTKLSCTCARNITDKEFENCEVKSKNYMINRDGSIFSDEEEYRQYLTCTAICGIGRIRRHATKWLINLPVEMKLETDSKYLEIHMSCEKLRNEAPETFDIRYRKHVKKTKDIENPYGKKWSAIYLDRKTCE